MIRKMIMEILRIFREWIFKAFQKKPENDERRFLDIKGFEDGDSNFQDKLYFILDLCPN
jgi:hypothetical protein